MPVKGRHVERGDILELDLNPTQGREIKTDKNRLRPVLVLSPHAFNKASGFALVAPITQGGVASRENGFSVTLVGAGTKTQGVVLCEQVRTVDLNARKHRLIESAPLAVIDEALDAVRSLLD